MTSEQSDQRVMPTWIRTKWTFGLAVAAGLLTAGALVTSTARPASAEPIKVAEIGNIGGVENGPTAPSIFTTTKAWHVVEIWTYHWNDAEGATPGRVGLKSLGTGQKYGPFKASGRPGQGGVPNAYWVAKVSFDLPPGRYQYTDSDPSTWAQNQESDGRGFANLMVTPADVWPPLPSALVSLASVSNGCGGGTVDENPRWGDTSTYRDSNNPFGETFEVNFRKACNVHDAGYNGARVRDPFSGEAIRDFFRLTRDPIDTKFLADQRTLCDEQIPATAPGARSDCKGHGGKTSFGAESRYDAVRLAGHKYWTSRPHLRGVWLNTSDDRAAALSIDQSTRTIKATWHGGHGHAGLRGEFRGTLITRGEDSIVRGSARVINAGETTRSSMTIRIVHNEKSKIIVHGPGVSGTHEPR